MKLGICIPWHTSFIWTAGIFNIVNLDRPPDSEVVYFNGTGWCSAARHQNSVDRALGWGADRIIFLDPDQIHQFDTITRINDLLGHWDMASARVPSRSMAMGSTFKKHAWIKQDEELVEVTESEGLIEIHVIGTGVLGLNVDVLKLISRPYFKEIINESKDDYSRLTNMDNIFVQRLTRKGVRLVCDLDIEVQHLNIFPIDESYAERFADGGGKRLDRYL